MLLFIGALTGWLGLRVIQSERPDPDTPDIRVVGPPRSGTNLAKYLIETHTDLCCRFNHGWWKHAIIPALMQDGVALRETIPTIVLFREPMTQMASFFKFARQGRNAIRGGTDLKVFLRSPIKMAANQRQIYFFPRRWSTGLSSILQR